MPPPKETWAVSPAEEALESEQAKGTGVYDSRRKFRCVTALRLAGNEEEMQNVLCSLGRSLIITVAGSGNRTPCLHSPGSRGLGSLPSSLAPGSPPPWFFGPVGTVFPALVLHSSQGTEEAWRWGSFLHGRWGSLAVPCLRACSLRPGIAF